MTLAQSDIGPVRPIPEPPPRPPRKKKPRSPEARRAAKLARKQAKRQSREEARRRRLTGLPYERYIHGRDWRYLRNAYLRKVNRVCESCGRRAIQVHHKRYPPYGEWWKDSFDNLEALCGICHLSTHSDPEVPWRP